LLKEFHHDKKIPYFLDYAKKYTDCPYLVELKEVAVANSSGNREGNPVLPTATADCRLYAPGQLVPAGRLQRYQQVEKNDWKFLMWDAALDRPKMPMGSSGDRWGSAKGKWNLLLKDGQDGSEIQPTLTFLDKSDAVVQVRLNDFAEG